VDRTDGPPPGEHNSFHGVPVAWRDERTRAAIASLGAVVDTDAVTAASEAALSVREWGARLSGSTETSAHETARRKRSDQRSYRLRVPRDGGILPAT